MLILKKLLHLNIPNLELKFVILKKISKEYSVIYARLINQYKFKYQTLFSARLDK